ncbi:otolith matrix protein OMM-64-like [Mytilus edulis]|uniref:otolith matrix protein OMM-64-like n=1 Tax=Mytilus edulis TaxID=6550 RepID=UPI0039EE9C77
MPRLIVIFAITFLFLDIVVSRPRLKRNPDFEPMHLFVEKQDEGENNGEQLQVAVTTEQNNIDRPIRYDDGPLFPRDFRVSKKDEPSTDDPVRFDDEPLNPNDNQLQQVEQNENTDPNSKKTPTRFDNGGLTADLELNRPEDLELDNENTDLNQVGDDSHSKIDNGGLYPNNLQTNETDDSKLNETKEKLSTDAPVRFDDGPMNQYDNQLQQVRQNENTDPSYNETPTRFNNGGLTADLELNRPEDIQLDSANKDSNQAGDDTHSQMANGGLYPSNLQTNETDDNKLNETNEQPSTDSPVRFDDGPLNPNDNQLQQVEQNENTDPNYDETPTRFDNGGLTADLEINRPQDLQLDNENKDLNKVGEDTRFQIDNGGLYPSNLQTNETDISELNETKEKPSTDASLRFNELNENDNNEEVHSSITDMYGDKVDKSENDDIDSSADNFNGMRMKRFINQFEEDDLNDLHIDGDKNNDIHVSLKFDTNSADLYDEGNNQMDNEVDPNAKLSDKDDTDDLKANDTDNFNENDIDNPDEENIDEDDVNKDDIDENDIDEDDIDEDDIDKDDVNKDDIN